MIIWQFTLAMALFLVVHEVHATDKFRSQYVHNKIQDDTIDACRPNFCADATMNSKVVKEYCAKYSQSAIDGRCCSVPKPDNTTAIIGLDYSKCTITKLSRALRSLARDDIKTVEIVDLQSNTLEECDNQAYEGFLKLDELYIPESCACPGANYSWIHPITGHCSGQRNICNSTYTNVECTPESECAENGPGNFLCNCKVGFSGYKCLNEGEFPVVTFTISICLSTLLLSALLWHTQRRHVKV